MDKDRDNIEGKKPLPITPGQIFNEVIQTIESMERKTEKF